MLNDQKAKKCVLEYNILIQNTYEKITKTSVDEIIKI